MTIFAALDLETTGLSPEDDKILEVAWCLTDDKFNPLGPVRSYIVEHDSEGWAEVWSQLRVNDFVREMHQGSGLYDDLRTKRASALSAIALHFRDDVERASDRFENLPVHLTGLSIGFDRSFLQRDPSWSLFFDNDVLGFSIHHRLLDLSSVKMMLDASGVEWERAPSGGHRAASDVQEVVEQGQIFRQLLGTVSV